MAEFPTTYMGDKRKKREHDTFKAITQGAYGSRTRPRKGAGKNTFSEISPFKEKKREVVKV